MLNRENLDILRLKRDLRAAAVAARELKAVLRRRWTRPMAAEQRALAELARRVTRLCVLRAFLRGRFHLARQPEGTTREEYHAQIAARAAREYEISEAACSSSTSAST